MQLRNHIAYRFLTDDKLMHEMMQTTYPDRYDRIANGNESEEDGMYLKAFYDVINFKDQRAYYITNTVLDKLDLLKITKKNNVYDWTIFKHIQDQKLTFIFKDNMLLRVRFNEDTIQFCHVEFTYFPKERQIKEKSKGNCHWVNFWVDRITGLQCEWFSHEDVIKVERMIYHLLCFFFLSENTEILVKPGKSYGTRKQHDALSNDTNVPVTIVNSNWNITSIRTEGFDVRGHFRLQPCGHQLSETKMIFIEPFRKNGYIRKATNETN